MENIREFQILFRNFKKELSLGSGLILLCLLHFFLTTGGLTVGTVESVAVVKHSVYATGNDGTQVIAFAECALCAYPYGVSEADCALCEFHIIVCCVDSLEDVGLILRSNGENLGEKEVQEQFILLIFEVNELKTLELELQTEVSCFGLEAFFGKEG